MLIAVFLQYLQEVVFLAQQVVALEVVDELLVRLLAFLGWAKTTALVWRLSGA